MRSWFYSALTMLMLASPVVQAQSMDPDTVHVVASPNVMSWPATAHITAVDVEANGMRVSFDRCASWPAVTPPGWTGPLLYTLWLFQNIGGTWYGSGIIQFWACDQYNGGPIYSDNQIARNWVYGTQWSPMTGVQPAPGTRIGFMVSAGNARMQDDHLVAERSDIVEVAMPSGPGLVPFVSGSVVPTPTPAPTPAPAPLPSIDLSGVYSQLSMLSAKFDTLTAHVDAVNANVSAGRAENQSFFEAVKTQWRAIVGKAAIYAGPIIAALFAGRATK